MISIYREARWPQSTGFTQKSSRADSFVLISGSCVPVSYFHDIPLRKAKSGTTFVLRDPTAAAKAPKRECTNQITNFAPLLTKIVYASETREGEHSSWKVALPPRSIYIPSITHGRPFLVDFT